MSNLNSTRPACHESRVILSATVLVPRRHASDLARVRLGLTSLRAPSPTRDHPSPLSLPPAHETRGGARSPPPSPTPSGISVAAGPAAHETRDHVSFSFPYDGFGIGLWVITAWASPGPRPADRTPSGATPGLGRARGGHGEITRVWKTMPLWLPSATGARLGFDVCYGDIMMAAGPARGLGVGRARPLSV